MKRLMLWLSVAVVFLWMAPGGAVADASSKTLVYSWAGNVGPLNPHLYSPNQMFAQATVHPCLAKRWDISADGREYVFHLRKNVVFSDGTPFNAAAVKKNIDAVPANAKLDSWLELVRQIKGMEVLDEYTVKILLKDPYYPFLQDMALAPWIAPYPPEQVGLSPSDAEKYPHQFSGGDLRRVCIAQAIALNPGLIVLDEAVSSLDMLIQARVLDLLMELQQELGTTYLFISHDIRILLKTSQRLAVMHEGRLVEQSGDMKGVERFAHPAFTRLLGSILPLLTPGLC